VNWKPGQDVIIPTSVSDEEAKKKYTQGFKTHKPYLRTLHNPNRVDEEGQASRAAAGTLQLGELTVRRMGFGAMRVTTDGSDIWGPPGRSRTAKLLLHRALDLGINFLDTADSYGPHASESFIAETLYPYPEGLVIGTKGGIVRPSRRSWDPDGRPSSCAGPWTEA